MDSKRASMLTFLRKSAQLENHYRHEPNSGLMFECLPLLKRPAKHVRLE
jgi:hypothetical protein